MPQGSRAVMPRPYEITIESFEVPAPGPGQLLMETQASAISPGTELAVYTGIHQWLSDPTRTWPKFPFTPGYSSVGRVAALGDGVEGFAVGDRLVWPGRHETHALISVTNPEAAIWRIDRGVPDPVAALALITRFPLTALVRAEQLLGQSVAVMGLGTIGQITLRLFSAAGAYPLIGIDPLEGRRAVAMRTSGVAAIDPTDGDLRQSLRAVNGGELPDIVVEATGNPQAVKSAMNVVVDGGKVIMVGSPRGIAGDVDFYWDLHGRSLALIGAHGSAIGVEPREKFPFIRDRALRLIVHMLESGKLKIDDLITHHVHTSELKSIYDGLLNQRDEFLAATLHW
jgi:2-desacetyl-2-hydroxyethyl bacteriochlorophyllide A dehydrogenase